MKSSLARSFAALFLLSIAACSQDSGESCQVNRDCGDGLMCCKGTAADRGVCEAECETGVENVDSGTSGDSGASNEDAATSGEDSGADGGEMMSVDDGGESDAG